jgi:hypothetical protein
LIFEILNDFLAQHVGIGEIVGFFEAFVSEAEDVEAGFVAIMGRSKVNKFSDPNYLTARYLTYFRGRGTKTH